MLRRSDYKLPSPDSFMVLEIIPLRKIVYEQICFYLTILIVVCNILVIRLVVESKYKYWFQKSLAYCTPVAGDNARKICIREDFNSSGNNNSTHGHGYHFSVGFQQNGWINCTIKNLPVLKLKSAAHAQICHMYIVASRDEQIIIEMKNVMPR